MDSGLRTPDYGLRTSDSGLRTPDYGLPSDFHAQPVGILRAAFLADVRAGRDGGERAGARGDSTARALHEDRQERDGETTIYRRVYVWSDRLCVAGFADVVEERAGELVPVEYKHGRMGRWLNDHVQLCAQALCLEERTGRPVPRGEIFYWGNRRRERIELTPALRARTEETIGRAFALIQAGRILLPLDHRAKCYDCSLESICLPREVLILNDEQQRIAASHKPRST